MTQHLPFFGRARGSLALALLLTPQLMGCQVVHRAEQCKRMAQLINAHEAELAPQLTENPTSQALLHKANIFAKLAKELQQNPIRDPDVSKERDALVGQLSDLAKHLRSAEKLVVEGARLLEQEKKETEEREAKEAHDTTVAQDTKEAQDTTVAQDTKEAQDTTVAQDAKEAQEAQKGTKTIEAPPPESPSKTKNKQKADHVAKKARDYGRRGPIMTKTEQDRANNRRNYLREKGSVETLSKQVTDTLRGLSNACRG